MRGSRKPLDDFKLAALRHLNRAKVVRGMLTPNRQLDFTARRRPGGVPWACV